MTFYILLSIAAILTTIVGGGLIWGFDIVRANEVERDVLTEARRLKPATVPQPVEITHHHAG